MDNNLKQMKLRFQEHRSNANSRDIPFEFEFGEWKAWWEKHLGPDWMKKRGIKRGLFVMARVGDTGSYSEGNVRCITYETNLAEEFANGKCGFKKGQGGGAGRPNSKGIKITAKEAIAIYKANTTQRALAARYGVSERLVRLIKRKQVWQHILNDI